MLSILKRWCNVGEFKMDRCLSKVSLLLYFLLYLTLIPMLLIDVGVESRILPSYIVGNVK